MSTYGLWLSAAGMKVNEYRQTLLANNMANADTTGFKRELAVVAERRPESSVAGGAPFAHPVLDGIAGGLHVRPTYLSFEQGSIEATGRPLDVAIDGEGFFAVTDGEVTRYTRDGEFTRNTQGELVLAAGDGLLKLLSEDGGPIVLDEAGGKVSLLADGRVRQGDAIIGKLAVFAAQDKQALRKVGGNLFDAGDTVMVPMEPTLRPESRERSNFDVMEGLATMIEAARAYQLNATMIQMQDQLVGQAVTRIARVV